MNRTLAWLAVSAPTLLALTVGAACSSPSDTPPPSASGGGTSGPGGQGGDGGGAGGTGGVGAGGSGAGAGGTGGTGTQACPPGTLVCEGSVKKICDGNGGYSFEEDCAPNACSTTIGCVTCSAGQILCEGTVKKVCDGQGGFSQTTDCAPSSCAPNLGCVTCAAGNFQCAGSVKKVCDGQGGYSDVTDCAPKLCHATLGCVECVPGLGTCNGDVGTYCKPDGSGYLTEECDAVQGTTCQPQTGRCEGECGEQSLGKSYIGCDYFPTVTVNSQLASTFNFAVAVSNTKAVPASVTITRGANTVKTETVAPNSVAVIKLPWVNALKMANASTIAPSSAYRLRTNVPVTVYQFNPLEYQLGGNSSFTNDASLLLPVNAWTGKYRVAAWRTWNLPPYVILPGFYAVVASQDGTTVQVTPSPSTGSVKSGAAGISTAGSGTVTLNRGDVLQVLSETMGLDSGKNDLTGTLVVADRPVQVVGGHDCPWIPDAAGWCDHLEEVMFPVQTLSDTYFVTAPLIPTGGAVPKVEMVRVIATEDATSISFDPIQPNVLTTIAQAGGFVELSLNSSDFQVKADKPILVAQYMTGQAAGGNSGDPAMALVVNSDQFRDSYLFHSPTNYEYSYLNVVAPDGATLTLDGAPITSPFTPIGASGYSVARVAVSNAGDGNHTITGSKAFGITVYGYGQYTSYWYPGGLNLKNLHD